MALDQEGFCFRNDDGDEDSATWKASQDTNVLLAAGSTVRLRILIDATGNPDSQQFELQYRHKPSGGSFGGWKKVPQ